MAFPTGPLQSASHIQCTQGQNNSEQEGKMGRWLPIDISLAVLVAAPGNPLLPRLSFLNLAGGPCEDTELKESGDFLVRVLDDDRLSDRKQFPLELKRTTW